MKPEKFLEKYTDNIPLRQQVKSLQSINRKLKVRNEYYHSVIGKFNPNEIKSLYWDTFLWMTKNPDKMEEWHTELEQFMDEAKVSHDYSEEGVILKFVEFFASRVFPDKNTSAS